MMMMMMMFSPVITLFRHASPQHLAPVYDAVPGLRKSQYGQRGQPGGCVCGCHSPKEPSQSELKRVSSQSLRGKRRDQASDGLRTSTLSNSTCSLFAVDEDIADWSPVGRQGEEKKKGSPGNQDPIRRRQIQIHTGLRWHNSQADIQQPGLHRWIIQIANMLVD